MTDLEILDQMNQLLATEETWCQGYSARTSDDNPVGYDHPKACKWCISGAHAKIVVNPISYSLDLWHLISRTSRKAFNLTPVQVNDDLGFTAVKDLISLTRNTLLQTASS